MGDAWPHSPSPLSPLPHIWSPLVMPQDTLSNAPSVHEAFLIPAKLAQTHHQHTHVSPDLNKLPKHATPDLREMSDMLRSPWGEEEVLPHVVCSDPNSSVSTKPVKVLELMQFSHFYFSCHLLWLFLKELIIVRQRKNRFPLPRQPFIIISWKLLSMTEFSLHMTPYNPMSLFCFDFQTATMSLCRSVGSWAINHSLL